MNSECINSIIYQFLNFYEFYYDIICNNTYFYEIKLDLLFYDFNF